MAGAAGARLQAPDLVRLFQAVKSQLLGVTALAGRCRWGRPTWPCSSLWRWTPG